MTYDFSAAIVKEPFKRRLKGRVWFNSLDGVPIDDEGEATHFLISGTTGGGKTFLIVLLGSQFPHALFFDGKGGGKVEQIAKELGVDEEWEFLGIEGYSQIYPDFLKINVRDMTPDILNILEARKDTKLRQIRGVLEEFLSLPRNHPHKTFAAFKELLTLNRPVYDDLVRELGVILAENDDGMPLEELITGKKCIDLNSFPLNNRAIGVVAAMALQYKKTSQDKGKLFFGLDEADSVARIHTSLNEAFATVFRQGRSSNISGLMSCTEHGMIGNAIFQNSKVFFFFESAKKQTNKVWKDFGVDLRQSEFDQMRLVYPKGNCVLWSPTFDYMNQKMIHVDPSFFRFEVKKQEAPDYKKIDLTKYV